MRRRLLACMTFGVTALAVATSLPSSQAAQPPVQQADQDGTADEQYAQSLRRTHGLPNDLATVRSRERSSSSLSTEFGIPMTREEVETIQGRTRLADRVGEVHAQQARDVSDFAGSWMEPADGSVHFSFTGPRDEAERQALVRQLPKGTTVVVHQVENSELSLIELQRRISVDLQSWRDKGVMIEGSSRKMVENKVSVAVSTDVATAQRVLHEAYGVSDRQLVVRAAQGPGENLEIRDLPNGPAYGGIWINWQTDKCTATLSNALSLSNNTSRFTITAGHCTTGATGSNWYQDETAATPDLGKMLKNMYNGTSNCDCAIIGPISSSRVTATVLTENNSPYAYTATARNDASYTLGRSVCFSGATSAEDYGYGVTCGVITDVDGTKYVQSRTLINMVETDIKRAYRGDSGAPFGSGQVFMGVLQGFDVDGNLLFSRSPNIAGMNVTLTY